MFYRYANTQSEKQFRSDMLKVRSTFNQTLKGDNRFSFYYTNGYNHEKLPVITQQNPDNITWMHWGIVPNSIKGITAKDEHLKMGYSLYERSQLANSSWLTKHSIESQRCLVPATGFFLWKHMKKWKHSANEERSEKYHYYAQILNIYNGNDPMPYCFPAVYNKWEDPITKQNHEGFIIFHCETLGDTMDAITATSHKYWGRMPCIIGYEDYAQWLSSDFEFVEASDFLCEFDNDHIRAYSVTQNLNKYNVDHNRPETLDYHPYSVLETANQFNCD